MGVSDATGLPLTNTKTKLDLTKAIMHSHELRNRRYKNNTFYAKSKQFKYKISKKNYSFYTFVVKFRR